MKILFKYTSRSRPELFKRGMDSIINNCVSDNYQILVSIDEDDSSMRFMADYYKNNDKVVFCVGTSTGKINAINRDLDKVKDWDVIVNMSDDMVFNRMGFDDVIRTQFYENGVEAAPNLDLCLHFPDGNTTELITMSILGRKFFDRFGYIYHPSYVSLFCDNEQTDVSKMLGCYRFVDTRIFDHLHPAFAKAISDEQYEHTESYWHIDEKNYTMRRQMNFGL